MHRLQDTVWPTLEDEKVYKLMDRERFDNEFSAFQHKQGGGKTRRRGLQGLAYLFLEELAWCRLDLETCCHLLCL